MATKQKTSKIKVGLYLTRPQFESLEIESTYRGRSVSEIATGFVVEMMEVNNILPELHQCPACLKPTFNRPGHLCQECAVMMDPEAERV